VWLTLVRGCKKPDCCVTLDKKAIYFSVKKVSSTWLLRKMTQYLHITKQNLISLNQTGTEGILNATKVDLQDINLTQITRHVARQALQL